MPRRFPLALQHNGLPSLSRNRKFVIPSLNLPRQNRIDTLEFHLHAGDLEYVSFFENKLLLTDELRQSEMYLDDAPIRLLQPQGGAHSSADLTLGVVNVFYRSLKHCLC